MEVGVGEQPLQHSQREEAEAEVGSFQRSRQALAAGSGASQALANRLLDPDSVAQGPSHDGNPHSQSRYPEMEG